MKKRFFIPYVGEYYTSGINRKKVLIVGASFYCSRQECPFFEKCTSTEMKSSSAYDEICPVYKKYGKVLRDEPSYCVEEVPDTYRKFSESLQMLTGTLTCEESWKYVAFTNYVQYFLPNNGSSFRSTKLSDLSQRDFDAFIETVEELEPDIVIIWGCVINKPLKEYNQYVIDSDELSRTNGYVCRMKCPNSNRIVTLINPYHPSSSAWYSSKKDFEFYLEKVIND